MTVTPTATNAPLMIGSATPNGIARNITTIPIHAIDGIYLFVCHRAKEWQVSPDPNHEVPAAPAPQVAPIRESDNLDDLYNADGTIKA